MGTHKIVLSSFFFIIPSIYAYINNLYYYSVLLIFTSLISANYWKKATYSWRRNLDLCFSKISFCVFISSGVIYIKTSLVHGFSVLFVLLYLYYLSGKLLKSGNNNWYKYHFLFHLIITYEQIIILNAIIYK